MLCPPGSSGQATCCTLLYLPRHQYSRSPADTRSRWELACQPGSSDQQASRPSLAASASGPRSSQADGEQPATCRQSCRGCLQDSRIPRGTQCHQGRHFPAHSSCQELQCTAGPGPLCRYRSCQLRTTPQRQLRCRQDSRSRLEPRMYAHLQNRLRTTCLPGTYAPPEHLSPRDRSCQERTCTGPGGQSLLGHRCPPAL
jgi:hypothetical protein